MKSAGELLLLGVKVLRIMACSVFRGLCAFCDWLWRRILITWRSFPRFPIWIGRFKLPWSEDRGNTSEEPGPISGETAPEKGPGAPEVGVDFYQREVAAGQRAADHRRGPAREEADDDDKFRVSRSDPLYCDYDSTWETEEEQGGAFKDRRKIWSSKPISFSKFENAARDMQNYRHGYPTSGLRWPFPTSASREMPNLKFYLGEKPSIPDSVFIHEFHSNWYGEYDTLEYIHTYIQWLFPLPEPGMNYDAKPLTKEEMMAFSNNITAKSNLFKSYMLMLDFYGIELCDERTGQVKRSQNWRNRFHNLDRNSHNNLRITRILKCMGILGFPHLQAPLVHFFLQETLVNNELPNVKDSVLNYFVFAVLDKKERRSLLRFAYMNYDRKDKFVWCPKRIQEIWAQQSLLQPHMGTSGGFETGQ